MRKFSEKVDKTFSTKNWEDIIIERSNDSNINKLNDRRLALDAVDSELKRRNLKK